MMAKPNSLFTKLRQRVVDKIEPYPDKGEAWCVDCKLNGGLTQLLPGTEAAIFAHTNKHDPGDYVRVKMDQ